MWHWVLIMKSCPFSFYVRAVFPTVPTFMPACVYLSVYVRFTLKGPHSSSEAQRWPGARQAYNRAPVVWLVWSCVSSFGRDVKKKKKCLGQESSFCMQHLVRPRARIRMVPSQSSAIWMTVCTDWTKKKSFEQNSFSAFILLKRNLSYHSSLPPSLRKRRNTAS